MPTLTRSIRSGLWALPAWAALLFYGTLTHQPDPRTHPAEWSRYVTTGEFLVSHLVASILGGAIGVIGFAALGATLVLRGRRRLGVVAFVAGTLATAGLESVFGIAAFAQPAIGRAYLAGHTDVARMYTDDVNGTPLLVTALAAVLLLTTAILCLAVGSRRSRIVPLWGALALGVGGPVFAILGVVLANVVQSVGAGLLVVGSLAIALGARRALAADAGADAAAAASERPLARA